MIRPDIETLYRAHIAALKSAYLEILAAHGLDSLLIHSGKAERQSPFDDQSWPHKPTPFFAHWLPLIEEDAVVELGHDGALRLHRAQADSYWDSPVPLDGDHFWQAFDVKESSLEKVSGRVALICNHQEAAESLGMNEEQSNPTGLLADLDLVRARKTDYERHCIGEANRIAARGHEAVRSAYEAGANSELELHLRYLETTEQDSWQTPYGNIVAIGEHAAVLHHVHYARGVEEAPSLLVDAGATHMGYASDITRTWSRGHGEVAGVFGGLIAGLESVQQKLCAAVAPGVEYEDLHERAHRELAVLLRDLEVIAGDVDEMVGSGATRKLFPHGLGHSLGIQVHDVGCRPRAPRERNPFLRTTAVVSAGHVLTIEPGCYFIPSLLGELRETSMASRVNWSLIEGLRAFGGIRIEDNVAVTESGSINLTRDNWPPAP